MRYINLAVKSGPETQENGSEAESSLAESGIRANSVVRAESVAVAVEDRGFDLPHPGYVSNVAFLDEKTLLTTVDREVLRWDLSQRAEVGPRLIHISREDPRPLAINAIACAKERYLAVATHSAGVFVRDLQGSGDVVELPYDIPATAKSVAFSSDGEYLVAGFADGRVAVWGTSPWRFLRQAQVFDDALRALALSHDGSQIMAIGTERLPPAFPGDSGRRCFIRYLGTGSVAVGGEHAVGGNGGFPTFCAGGVSNFVYVRPGMIPSVYVTDFFGTIVTHFDFFQGHQIVGLVFKPGMDTFAVAASGGDPTVSPHRGVNLYSKTGAGWLVSQGFAAPSAGAVMFSPRGRMLAFSLGNSVRVAEAGQ